MHFLYSVDRKINGAITTSKGPAFYAGSIIDVEIYNAQPNDFVNLFYNDPSNLVYTVTRTPQWWDNYIYFTRYFLLPTSVLASDSGTQKTLTNQEMYNLLYPGYNIISPNKDTIKFEKNYASTILEYSESFEYNTEFGNLVQYYCHFNDKISGNTEDITVDMTSMTPPNTPIEPQPNKNKTTPLYTIPIAITPSLSGVFVTAIIVQYKKRLLQKLS